MMFKRDMAGLNMTIGLTIVVVLLIVGGLFLVLIPHRIDEQTVDTSKFGLDDWREIKTKEFSLNLPADWSFVEKQGIDSYIGEFTNGNATLTFDYGWYSGDVSQKYSLNDLEVVIQTTIIDGYGAKIFSSAENQEVGIYFENLGGEEFATNKLSIYGVGLDTAQRELALKIFRTIKFEKSNLPTAAGVYQTQEECESATGQKCSFVMCDYIPEGKTFEEVCGVGFKKGWQSIN